MPTKFRKCSFKWFWLESNKMNFVGIPQIALSKSTWVLTTSLHLSSSRATCSDPLLGIGLLWMEFIIGKLLLMQEQNMSLRLVLLYNRNLVSAPPFVTTTLDSVFTVQDNLDTVVMQKVRNMVCHSKSVVFWEFC